MNISDKIKRRLADLYDLADRGATAGEKNAARKAIDRLLAKYDIGSIDPADLRRQKYRFKYSSKLEMWLINKLRMILLDHTGNIYRSNHKVKNGRVVQVREIVLDLEEMNYITLECAYEYFRRHMNKEWKRLGLPVLARCRKKKTRRRKRAKLQEEFFMQYCIASKLYKEGELRDREISSQAELKRATTFDGIKGGAYNNQVSNGLYLNGKNNS